MQKIGEKKIKCLGILPAEKCLSKTANSSLRRCYFCMHSSFFCSLNWQVSLLSLTLNTTMPAAWAALPSVSCYKPEQKLSTNLWLYSQNSVFICDSSATSKLKTIYASFLCFCVDYSPASLSVIQKRVYTYFVCIVTLCMQAEHSPAHSSCIEEN